ncbi:MAG: heavy metal translocating P-type ATPase, partial [Geopsychrobacter sp.]|nr:heavy metal translocating P-type ATPase [Geopsychrobacter sp.]
GTLTLRVTAKASDSFIARIGRMIEEAQTRKAPIQNLADRVSGIFIPGVLGIALATFIFWGADQNALLHAITVLVVACPCALGLATPTAVMVATGRAATEGVLFRGADTLEALTKVKLLAFDKTGTLTQGRPGVCTIHSTLPTAEFLTLVAGLEAGSRHPLAWGIMAEVKKRELDYQPLHDVQQTPGQGLSSKEAALLGGNADFLRTNGIQIPEHNSSSITSDVHFAQRGEYIGYITLADSQRLEASTTLELLRQQGYSTLLLSGDKQASAESLARQLHLDHCLSPLTPEMKKTEIERLIGTGQQVLMTGDGINDAPALAAANVSCSIVGSSDIAMEQAQLLLTRANLLLLPWALNMAKQTLSVIRQNLFWAFSYNLVAIPLAASGQLLPVYGAAAMALSSLGVLLNSLRLKRISPPC